MTKIQSANEIIEMNHSEKEILMSECAFSGSAVNTISVKLLIRGQNIQRIENAVCAVMSASDIFGAELKETDGTLCFSPCDFEPKCETLSEKSADEAAEYVKKSDSMPLSFPKELYSAQIIPISDGSILLYVKFHHIIIDGYGMSLFAQKVLDALEGKAVPQSDFFTGPGSAKGSVADEAFWIEHFSDAEFSPSVFPAQPKGMNIMRNDVPLDSGLAKQIAGYANMYDVTEAYVFAAAYAVYLAGATGKRDAVFLMPRLNREPEQMNILGCYMLLIPVRVHIDDMDSFFDICRKVQDASRAASQHKACGYDGILQALRNENLISDTVSEYVFNYYRFAVSSDIDFKLDISVAGAMHNHLTWTLFRDGNNYSFGFDFREGVYTGEKAGFFADAIIEILRAGVKNTPVSEISILGVREKKKLSEVCGVSYQIDSNETIVSLFEKASSLYGFRPAVYSGSDSLTFDGLDSLSGKIARALVLAGVKPGDRVAFMLKRDIRLIPTMLGILKAGAAFIPVDPAYPYDRVKYILEDSAAALLISSSNVEAAAEYTYTEIDELINGASDAVLPQIAQSSMAYMIYTSGTTGRPKGVMLSHRGIVNIVHPDNNPFNRDIVQNGHGIVAIGSICFDISLFEIFVPLMNGLFVELGNEKAMLDAGELSVHINRHGADILHCTPSRIVAYLGNPEFKKSLKTVKMVLSAGEVLPDSLINELKNNYGIRIYNGYGPTETTIGATITEAGDDKTIGSPIGNTGIVLLNPDRRQVPDGAIGEICIYGAGVGIGYHGREEETKEKFIQWNGLRLYRTGDVGCIADDGKRLLYNGRIDRQIKLRGLRIELPEIEKVMGSYDGISQVACIVRKTGKTERLAGFYTVSEGKSVDENALRAHMRESLTAYMIPDILCEIDEMPQTPGGKTDNRALQNIPVDYVTEYRAPSNHIEKLICDAFAKALHIARAGVDDNYFELGGNSLGSVELLLSIEEALGVDENEIEYGDIYKYPTPALLAERINDKSFVAAGYAIDELDYYGIDEYLRKNEGKEIKLRKPGNILLTGATGYLGTHILSDLLKRPDEHGKVYCLARPKGRLSAEKRIKGALFYYDECDYSGDYGSGWEVIEGDITLPEIFKTEFKDSIDVIINPAANVAHFAYGDALERINVTGVENLINLALKNNAILCQISTISVGGVFKQDGMQQNVFTERNLYIGQEIYNQYIYTKYMAEYKLLRAAVDKGLAVKIMRVGNLQGRSQDGEFQMNMRSNAFTRQLSAYIKMKAVPESVFNSGVNFSPVDETAHMIVSLTQTDSIGVFHVYPPTEVPYEQIFTSLNSLGHEADVVPDEDFEKLLTSLKYDKNGRETVDGLLTERPDGRYKYVPVVQEITDAKLQSIGEHWRVFTEEYLTRYLAALDGMDMF